MASIPTLISHLIEVLPKRPFPTSSSTRSAAIFIEQENLYTSHAATGPDYISPFGAFDTMGINPAIRSHKDKNFHFVVVTDRIEVFPHGSSISFDLFLH